MTITYYNEIEQGTDQWHALRLGILTASAVKELITEKTLKIANNDKVRGHIYELAAQRITQYTEPQYLSDAMIRGLNDEGEVRSIYDFNYSPVNQTGFIINDDYGFPIGCSPDGLVGDDGMIEIKSRMQKFQMQTIVDDELPSEYRLQVQTQLLVSGRGWCDFISYCGGMHLFVKRVYPDHEIHAKIIEAAELAEKQIVDTVAAYHDKVQLNRLFPTQRKEIETELTIGDGGNIHA